MLRRDLLSSIFHLRLFRNCGENEIQAGLISSASVGATPTPATILVDSWKLIVERRPKGAACFSDQLSTLNHQLSAGGDPAAGL